MSLSIWKYPVPIKDGFELLMPQGARVLSVQRQDGQFVLWAVVNPDALREARRFRVFGTGNPFDLDWPRNSDFIGTVQQTGLVWHVFSLHAGAK